jgi:hypothetical protein
LGGKAPTAVGNRPCYRTLYGYHEKTENHSEIGLKIAYKKGRALHIEINTSNTVADKYMPALLEWFKHFVIIPDK